MQKSINLFLIKEDTSTKEAMRQMGRAGEKILYVVDNEKILLGALTDGDIRRWFLKEGSLASDIKDVYYKHPIYVKRGAGIEKIKKLMLDNKIESVPCVDANHKICKIYFWDNVFVNGSQSIKEQLDVPVVIMAGGRGTRLDPFTRILPKPLIPIGEKSILEIILDKFKSFGATNFYLSVNHKSQMIKAYFDELNGAYAISYLKEDEPLGTAGGLKFLEGRIEGDIFVSNCDIIIESDYHEMYQFHKDKDNDITIIGSFRHFTIPYGICRIENGGTLIDIEEKPEYDYLVNTGMYVIKSDVLKFIPKNQLFNFTDLIEKVRVNKGKVGVYPIDEKSWIDVGQWEEYHKSVKELGLG